MAWLQPAAVTVKVQLSTRSGPVDAAPTQMLWTSRVPSEKEQFLISHAVPPVVSAKMPETTPLVVGV